MTELTSGQFFKQSVLELAAESPDREVVLLRAVAGLTEQVLILTEYDPDLAKLAFNEVLNRVDPAWRVKVSD